MLLHSHGRADQVQTLNISNKTLNISVFDHVLLTQLAMEHNPSTDPIMVDFFVRRMCLIDQMATDSLKMDEARPDFFFWFMCSRYRCSYASLYRTIVALDLEDKKKTERQQLNDPKLIN